LKRGPAPSRGPYLKEATGFVRFEPYPLGGHAKKNKRRDPFIKRKSPVSRFFMAGLRFKPLKKRKRN